MKAFVYCCFDPKVWPRVAEIFDERFGKETYFFATDPGAVKNLISPPDRHTTKIVISKIKAAYTLHPFDAIVLINHSGCGAYRLAGKVFDNREKEEEFHRRELRKAVRFIRKYFPKIKIEIHYFLKEKGQVKW